MWLGLCRSLLVFAVLGNQVTGSPKEESCPVDTFQCKGADGGCIPKNWVCDSDEDCPGGEDETANCSIPTCPSNQFQCSRGAARCVPHGWVCDGENDCDDGSDENATTCKTHKPYGKHVREGSFVDTFKCVPNKYRCPGTHTCISMEKICDGIVDCVEDRADEGHHCRNMGCKSRNCENCKETLQGPQCYCKDEQELNGTICTDLDECKYDGFCDQVCDNSHHPYACSCVNGYHKPPLTKDDPKEGSCIVNGTARLLLADTNHVLQLDMNGEFVSPQFTLTGNNIETLDYDIANNTVCWIGSSNSSKLQMFCSDLEKTDKTWTIMTHHRLSSVEQIARDWIGNNWYFADDVKETIFMCRGDGHHCVNIINIGIKRPKSLAVDPTRGFLFYADWSMDAKIERANMDGSNKFRLVTKKIVHPNGLALDYANQHVYWGDSFLDYIERVDYYGRNRRLIAHGVNVDHVSGLTVFGNYLYVSNHHNNSIVRVHRYIQNDMQVINKKSLYKPGDVHVIHQVKQPKISKSICAEKKCDHICVPVPHNATNLLVKAVCLCRAGYTLVNDTTCQKSHVERFLLYANAQQGSIQGIKLNDVISEQVIEPIVNLNRPIAIAFDAKDENIYYSDVSLLLIGRRNAFNDEEAEVFLKEDVTSSEGLAVDWIGRNLYWTDDGHQTINVVCLDNTSVVHTVISEANHPKAIVVDPNAGYMYWTDWVLKPSSITSKIEKAWLNGSQRETLVDTEIQWPNSLTLDYKTQTIYWADAYYDRIESISVDGSNRVKNIKIFTDLNHPYGIAVFEHYIYWTESLTGHISCLDTKTNVTNVIRNDSSPLFDLKLYDPTIQHIESNKPCATNKGGCAEMCLSIPGGAACVCGKGRRLKSDNRSCEVNPDYKPPDSCNSNKQFRCQDGSCINHLWKCDGDRDCLDASDEDYSENGICYETCEKTMYKCLNSSCIYQHLVCDGQRDCPHGDDEASCDKKDNQCPANHRKCRTGGRCIPHSWFCDKEYDCVDKSDEHEDCESTDCVEDQFKCGHGHCIPYAYRCDNEYDCPDHSDELDCKSWCDTDFEFQCKDKSMCVAKKYVCDGEKNCMDGSDEEANCSVTETRCHNDGFLCDGVVCIPGIWKCDGDDDCSDGTDESEVNCANGTAKVCHHMEMKCEDGLKCIPKAWICDGEHDCGDKSDEKDCSKDCKYPNFSCSENSNVCLPPEKVCDGNPDCINGTDESRTCHLMNFCEYNDCSHSCHITPTGYVCLCPDKMRIGSDQKTCEKIDACSQWGVCSQLCTSTPVGHGCYCREGYTLEADGYSCKDNNYDNITSYIIYSNRHEMRRVDLGKMTFVSLVAGLRNTIAIDYHYEKQLIFWTDVIDDKIYSGKMIQNITKKVPPEALTNIVPIVNVGLATTEGLAVDWIGEKLYWVESNLDQIEVANLNGSYRRTLVAGDMTSPRAIVVDPRFGYLFWTDWDGENPRIERCSMSGTHRKQLFDIHANYINGGWPNGITLDFEDERLYWVDARSDSIHTVTYDGEEHHLILQSHSHLAQPFAITMFETYVYWTDWRTNSLIKANKFNGSDLTEVQKTFTQPFDLHIYHPKRQPKAFNPCGVNNGGCSHLCLIGLRNRTTNKTTADCQCPHRMKLKKDNKTCEADNKFLIFVKQNEIRGVDLNNANYNVIPSITVRLTGNATSTTAIDYDRHEERLYWADLKRNVITSAYLNGSGVETIIDSGISSPQGFAIDYLSRNMYFSSYDEKNNSSTITVAKLSGAFRTEIVSKNLIQLNSLAIHPKLGVMFWSDVGGSKHQIIKANMDGSNRIVLVPDASNPASLTVDPKSDSLYYISKGHHTINQCFMNATCHQLNVNTSDFISMTIFNDELYVSKTNTIIKIIKIKNRLQVVVMRNNTPHISAMQVYDNERGDNGVNQCSKNNGGCSQLCLPTPNGKICKCTAGFTIANDGTECIGITSFMLYATESQIKGFTIENTDEVALASISKISLASAIDFHADDDYIYWIDSNSRTVSRIKRDLTNREDIFSEGLNELDGIAVDWIANNIYWTDRGHNTIEVSKTNGENHFVILHEYLVNPSSIVVHPVMGKLFFVNTNGTRKIMSAGLDGSNMKTVVANENGNPTGLTIDYEENHLYWCDKTSKTINRIDLSSGQSKKIIENLKDCVSTTLFGDFIYWADRVEGKGSIQRAKKTDGSEVEVVLDNLSGKLKDITVFDKSKQKGTNICEKNKFKCAELCLYGGEKDKATCVCSYGNLKSDGKTCEEYSDFLMFSEVTAIGSAHMMKKNDPNPPFKLISDAENMKNVIGIAYDYKRKRIYYSDIQRGDIQSVFFNGTDHKIIKTGLGSAEGLVFDSSNQTLYLTSYTNSSINRLLLSGSENGKLEELIKLSDKDHPRAIAIHTCRSRIFWTNWNDENPMIQRSYLNGYQPESIITNQIQTPNGLAIDHKADKLYWSDARLDKIERCDLDGRNRMVIVTSIPQHSFGLAVYGNYIYWTDWMLRAVLRANKYDGSEITWLKKNIKRQPMGIVAIAADADNCTLNQCYENSYGCEGSCTTNAKGQPICHCPDGHFLMPDKRRCVLDKKLKCNMTDFICEDGTMCLSIDKTCNGASDCHDSSDESKAFCETRKCPADYYMCANKRCVYLNKVCDGENDCGDGSDEMECPCKSDEFQCTNGACVLNKYRCDRDSDCSDHSDEMGCNLTCSDVEMDGEKVIGLVPCNTTSACIFPLWICDGTNDCWDNNDEKNCKNTSEKECPQPSFQCASGSCIPSQWRCDKDFDCADVSDENNCTYSCNKEQFQCNDSTCLPKTWECDNHPDCQDKSDEHDQCIARDCNDKEFKCKTGKCIPLEWKCDGDNDCEDGDDESFVNGCPPVLCEADEFMCSNRKCIPSTFFCDRDNDCDDNSDETSCFYPSCEEDEFKCVDRGMCVNATLRCNGFPDCPDHSDEANCTVKVCDGNDTMFHCDNGLCIPENLTCNNQDDCGDMSDEPLNCGIDECSDKRLCHQKCAEKKIGYECQCNPGYSLQADKKTCKDINECETTLPCTHYCKNSIGSFHCSCAADYELGFDRMTCKANKRPQLIVSNRYYIRSISVTSGNSTLLTEKLTNAVAIDLDFKEGYIYWSDITSRNSSINRMKYNGDSTLTNTEVLHSSTVRNPDGLAVDWVGRNLYWCDKTTDTIEVSTLSGRFRRVLLSEGLQEPRGLEVFPQKGVLFYTDWGDNHHIGRMWMDGSKRQTIIKDNLGWPNALTIDYITEKIIWADGSLDYIAMANLDGSGRRIIIGDSVRVPHVFALATFENHIYWTDWEHLGIYHANKVTGQNVTLLTHMLHKPMGLQVYHELKQVQVEPNPCEKMNCSHLCLLRPREGNLNDLESVCSCPENFHLSKDNRNCISNCTSAQFLCEQSSKCIPFWWKCDGHIDCDDKSDEPPGCDKYTCLMAGLFKCKNATGPHQCFPPSMICDGTQQCDDGSDEENCGDYPCLQHHFKCHADSKCIPEVLKCDGHKNCSDGEDEKNCPQTTCNVNQFQCGNGRCVPYVWRCDNDDDCGDWSDEPHNCTKLECKDDHIKCNKSGRCIPQTWTCDGDRDCGEDDDTDEHYGSCRDRTCDPTYFHCANGHCIPGRWKCDDYDDCRDGSDELNCSPRNCSEAEYRCTHGKCISKKLRCNKEINCEDGSDEANCEDIECSNDEFMCSTIKHCIPETWRCDGDTDCADGTDEWNCTRNCSENEFKCKNSICQSALWQCDGDDDCGDNSDEDPAMCANYICTPERFRCDNNICIWYNMVCDGKKDCKNGEDEGEMCREPDTCEPSMFKCNGTRSKCITIDKICDGNADCKDHSDEEPSLCKDITWRKNCSVNNGGCQHHCHARNDSVECSCKEGFQLDKDGQNCHRYNPCTVFGTCSQLCTYEDGDFKGHCSCGEGFKLIESSCFAEGDPPSMLVAEEGKIVHTALTNLTNQKDSQRLLAGRNHSQIVAMDVDVSGPEWQAFAVVLSRNHTWMVQSLPIVKKSKSKRQKRDDKSDSIKTLYISHTDIRGLTADWVGKRIYWTESATQKIMVASYNGERTNIIISTNLKDPQDVVVHPKNRQLFWSDEGQHAKIERSNLDGSNRTVLVDKDIILPKGLAVDYFNDRLYWADTKKYTIESVDLNGNDRRIIRTMTSSDPPYKLEVFEDFIYVLTYKTFSVLRLHKFGSKRQVLKPMYMGYDKVRALSVIQEHKQELKLANRCQNVSVCAPTQMCFNDWSDKGYSCKCPDGSEFDEVDKKCNFVANHSACTDSICQNGGTCNLNMHQKPKCSCTGRYQGDRCEIDRCDNYCTTGECVESKDKATVECKCSPGYKGERCSIYKCTGYCKNNGKCHIKDGEPSCFCRSVYTGRQCETETTDYCSQCKNGAKCITEGSGYIRCQCAPKFKGVYCDECTDLHCFNEGVCQRYENGTAYCSCTDGFNPDSQCQLQTCDVVCKSNNKDKGSCNCPCPAGYSGKNCDIKDNTPVPSCEHKDCHHGNCTILNNDVFCKCEDMYKGKNCDICKCHPDGQCIVKDGVTICRCDVGYEGDYCKSVTTMADPSKSMLNPFAIVIPIIVIFILIVLIIAAVIYKRRKSWQQYRHKRMQEPRNMDVNNPIYLQNDEEMEDMEPIETSPIYTGNKNTNFANPMYDMYNGESMTMLLQSGQNEENQLLEDGLTVRYFGTGNELTNNNTTSKA